MTPRQSVDAQPSGWHLKREIQLGHIITTVTVAISVVVYTQRIEQRVALLEHESAAQRERDDRQDRSTAEAFGEMRRQLEKIDAKLDRLVERDIHVSKK